MQINILYFIHIALTLQCIVGIWFLGPHYIIIYCDRFPGHIVSVADGHAAVGDGEQGAVAEAGDGAGRRASAPRSSSQEALPARTARGGTLNLFLCFLLTYVCSMYSLRVLRTLKSPTTVFRISWRSDSSRKNLSTAVS